MTTLKCEDNSTCNYVDVVIVGNGPSAITLSYMLHGYWPYYNRTSLSSPILFEKLCASKTSIVEQNLEYLSEGLVGRSSNPVSLLWDSLTHPDADIGNNVPSALSWGLQTNCSISHVVLGKLKPGGCWQRMERSMQILSQNSWMELPDYPFQDWFAYRCPPVDQRATTGDVRDYYEHYVQMKGLSPHFRDNHVVTSVRKVFPAGKGALGDAGEEGSCCVGAGKKCDHLWEVRGYRLVTWNHNIINNNLPTKSDAHVSVNNCYGNGLLRKAFAGFPSQYEEFCYVTPNVVLATGGYDVPNRLGACGEDTVNVFHSLLAFKRQLVLSKLSTDSAPVCVVGSGLSAAEAVLMLLSAGVPVLHVFRCGPNNPSLIFGKLPRSMYPEYSRVAMLMRGEEINSLYTAFPRQCVVDITRRAVLIKPLCNHRSTVSPVSDAEMFVDVSLVVVMVGARPDLSFLAGGGRSLGFVPIKPIDGKHNPVEVDPFSFQCQHEAGLFAMGPLVGDNFVRFAIGGALGIANHLNLQKCKHLK